MNKKLKKVRNMVEPHKHCPVCGSPIPMKERVCSADCQKVLEQQQKNIKKSRLMLFGVIVVFILVWAYFMFFK